MPKYVAQRRTKLPAKASPPVDGLTVGWMMTLVTALICEFGAAGTRAYVRLLHPSATLIDVFSGLLLFAAAVIGLVLLVLTPVVVHRKRSHPPRGFVVFAYVVGLVPWLGMLLQALE